jgi:amino-acid N-acetyltransferase
MRVTDITIDQALQTELQAISNLLDRSALPTEGLAEHLSNSLVARDGERVLGSAALEIYGREALLRSVAVDEILRGQGWGVRLTQAALDRAAQLGIQTVYLLTETAGDFFPSFGFTPIARSEVPANVRQSVEFTTLCSESALAMVKQIGIANS